MVLSLSLSLSREGERRGGYSGVLDAALPALDILPLLVWFLGLFLARYMRNRRL